MDDFLGAVLSILLIAGLVTLAASLIFLPTIIANERRSVSMVGIFLVNLLGCATGFFWFVALLWACLGAKKPPPSRPDTISPSTFAAMSVRDAKHK